VQKIIVVAEENLDSRGGQSRNSFKKEVGVE